MPIWIPNKKVACEPFESLALQVQGRDRGFAVAKQKNALLSTKVVFAPECAAWNRPPSQGEVLCQPGWTVYVRGDAMTLPWAKEVFEIAGKKVILIPVDQLQALDVPGFGASDSSNGS